MIPDTTLTPQQHADARQLGRAGHRLLWIVADRAGIRWPAGASLEAANSIASALRATGVDCMVMGVPSRLGRAI